VPIETIREIIEDSCLAPSAANKQPWKFIVVNNKDLIKRLSDESKKNILAYIEQSPDTPNNKYEAAMRNPDFNVFYNAPCLIYIVGSKQDRNLYVDCSLAACYFMFYSKSIKMNFPF
jgi:nitroreductase